TAAVKVESPFEDMLTESERQGSEFSADNAASTEEEQQGDNGSNNSLNASGVASKEADPNREETVN
ncbi:hypothetical protein ACTXT7_017470, partial [Hymenolepis weldensis]